MAEVLLHIGMHKTGTSALQACLSQYAPPGHVYARWQGPNHSPLFVLLFHDQDRLSQYHGFKKIWDLRTVSLESQKAQAFASLEADLDQCRKGRLILSAEAMSGALYERATERLCTFFKDRGCSVRVIGYVRPPRSLALSVLQQRLRSSQRVVQNPARFWPNYRKRLERFDRLFGRENVTLRLYDPRRFVDGNVVADFAEWAGIDLPRDSAQRVNASLCAEATAVLYLFCLSYGEVVDSPRASVKFAAFEDILRQLGNRRFALADEVWLPVAAANRADLDWMEARLGTTLPEGAEPDAIPLRNDRDLLRLAFECYSQLQWLRVHDPRARDSEFVAQTLLAMEHSDQWLSRSGPTDGRE